MVELVNIVGSMVRIQLKIMIFFSKFTDFNRFILSKRSISFLISENAISQKKNIDKISTSNLAQIKSTSRALPKKLNWTSEEEKSPLNQKDNEIIITIFNSRKWRVLDLDFLVVTGIQFTKITKKKPKQKHRKINFSAKSVIKHTMKKPDFQSFYIKICLVLVKMKKRTAKI